MTPRDPTCGIAEAIEGLDEFVLFFIDDAPGEWRGFNVFMTQKPTRMAKIHGKIPGNFMGTYLKHMGTYHDEFSIHGS